MATRRLAWAGMLLGITSACATAGSTGPAPDPANPTATSAARTASETQGDCDPAMDSVDRMDTRRVPLARSPDPSQPYGNLPTGTLNVEASDPPQGPPRLQMGTDEDRCREQRREAAAAE